MVTISENLCAYDDGSGCRYEVEVKHDAGKVTIAVTSGGDRIELESHEWTVVRDAVDRALDFVAIHVSDTGGAR